MSRASFYMFFDYGQHRQPSGHAAMKKNSNMGANLYKVLCSEHPELRAANVKIMRLTKVYDKKRVKDPSPEFRGCRDIEEIFDNNLLEKWVSRWCDVKHYRQLKYAQYIVVCLKSTKDVGVKTIFGGLFKMKAYLGEETEYYKEEGKDETQAITVYKFDVEEFSTDLVGKAIDWKPTPQNWLISFDATNKTTVVTK